MTREEAIQILKILKEDYWDDDGYGHETKEYDDTMLALDIAIKALEQQPCEDAISRADVKKYLSAPDANGDRVIYESDLDLLPPVQPKPKTGHWIYDNFNWRCSECNETPKTMGYVGTADFMTEHFKFCNHCGAKMVEVQEIEEI